MNKILRVAFFLIAVAVVLVATLFFSGVFV